MLGFYPNKIVGEGDKNKLAEIYALYKGLMLQTARKIIGDFALAEDAVSETILKIINNLHKITDVSSCQTRAYIVIIARNVSIDILRKQNKKAETPIENIEICDRSALPLDELSTKDGVNAIIKHIQ